MAHESRRVFINLHRDELGEIYMQFSEGVPIWQRAQGSACHVSVDKKGKGRTAHERKKNLHRHSRSFQRYTVCTLTKEMSHTM